MSTTEFCSPPNGESISNPSLDWLSELILCGDKDFWNAGSGEGAIKYIPASGSAYSLLGLILDEPHGFHIRYMDFDQNEHVSAGDGDTKVKVKVYVGGDPLYIPAALFIGRELTWVVVEHFCKTGLRSPKIRWARRKEAGY
jgi:hypothetical protein